MVYLKLTINGGENNMKEKYENTKTQAIEKAIEIRRKVWMYQFGNEFGFRFAELPIRERGILVARFDENGISF